MGGEEDLLGDVLLIGRDDTVEGEAAGDGAAVRFEEQPKPDVGVALGHSLRSVGSKRFRGKNRHDPGDFFASGSDAGGSRLSWAASGGLLCSR